MKKRISTIVVTAVITLIATTTVFASAYTILTFNGDMNDANRIRNITATMTAQTDQLNKTVTALQSSEGRSDFYTVYFNSMPKYTYTPFTTPPYTNVGQLYWSNSYNTLVSSNGAQTSIWFGNIWLPVTSAINGKVTGTNMAVADAMKLLHQIYYSQDLTNIGPNGATTQGATISVKYQGNDYRGTLSNLHWDTNANTLVANASGYYYFFYIHNISVKYNMTPNGGEWVVNQ
ncbi:hypothetical protein [Weissella confusa]|uniref:hypothetical protein n=1 Tax=Weissella confusa TaxID=1583 RepID=UPI0002465B7A|nr:hypothetical protein [Weissella confusa]CCF31609.1 Protein of unknown function [Weissella confusa LBAE C39-2]MBJ7625353.1 hypothetical protein [Weissella confusa]MBJ7644949.1 hypothetical protein [Weissella confusa]MDA5458661.1 hypothetical protein [Weissella confusa]QBZ03503.1 hypothetical protein C6P13_09660 [Weissella confusa]